MFQSFTAPPSFLSGAIGLRRSLQVSGSSIPLYGSDDNFASSLFPIHCVEGSQMNYPQVESGR